MLLGACTSVANDTTSKAPLENAVRFEELFSRLKDLAILKNRWATLYLLYALMGDKSAAIATVVVHFLFI